MPTSLGRSGVLVLVALLALDVAGAAQAGGDPATEAVAPGLEVERAGALVASGEFREGRERLLALLEREGPSEELRQRAARIDGLLRDASFGLAYRVPSERELPAGEVLSWRERDARIKLRYTPKSPQLDPESPVAPDTLAHLVFGSGGSRDLPLFHPRDLVAVGSG